MAGTAVTKMFAGESTMCVFSRVVDVGVSYTDAERVPLGTTVSITVEFGKGELNSPIVRAWLD